MSTITVSCLVSFLFSFENKSCEVINSQAHIQRLVRELPCVIFQRVCAFFDALHVLCVQLHVCTFRMLSRRGVSHNPPLDTHTPSLVAAWRLFDLDGADGSQPTGCQVGDRADTLSGFGEEYIVVI